jgi:hypothetical protein
VKLRCATCKNKSAYSVFWTLIKLSYYYNYLIIVHNGTVIQLNINEVSLRTQHMIEYAQSELCKENKKMRPNSSQQTILYRIILAV